MTVTALTQIPVDETRFEDLLELVQNSAGQTRESEGCLSFSILTNSERKDELFFFEVWETKALQEAYVGRRIEDGSMDQLAQYFAGAPTTWVVG